MNKTAMTSYWQKELRIAGTIKILRELYPKEKTDLEKGRKAMADLLISYKEWDELVYSNSFDWQTLNFII